MYNSPSVHRGTRLSIGALARGALWLAFLQAACLGADQIALTWEDNSTDELGFKIERAADDGRFVQIARVDTDIVTYVDPGVTRGIEYSYRVRAYNEIGDSDYSNVAKSGFISRLTNMSILAAGVSAEYPLSVGFVIGGASQKSVLVRGVGPALGAFGVSVALDDPVLSLYAGPSLFDANDDWESSTASIRVSEASRKVGAFRLPEAGRDAALLSELRSGPNTAELRGKGDSSGFAMIEIFDEDAIYSVRLVNVSALREVGAGSNALIIGFVVAGNNPKKLLIRAIGPTLSGFGVTGALTDPRLALYRAGVASPMQENDNWGGTDELKEAFRATAAFSLGDLSRDAALLVTLEPGAYTTEISSITGTSGTAMVEVYDVP